MSPKILAIIQRVYDEVHAALWALLCACVLFFVVVLLPTLPAKRAAAERLRAHEIAAEDRYYCEKWGMAAGTPGHPRCMRDLQELRARIARRNADEFGFDDFSF